MEISKIIFYLAKRNQSFFQFILNKPVKINTILFITVTSILHSILLFYILYFKTDVSIIPREFIWILWFFLIMNYIFSGIETSLNRLKPHNINQTDFKFLLSLPVKHFSILMMKLYETIVGKQIVWSFSLLVINIIVINNLFTLFQLSLTIVISILILIFLIFVKTIIFFIGISYTKIYRFVYAFNILYIWLTLTYGVNNGIEYFTDLTMPAFLQVLLDWVNSIYSQSIINLYTVINESQITGIIILLIVLLLTFIGFHKVTQINFNRIDLLKVKHQTDIDDSKYQKQDNILGNLLFLYFKRLVRNDSLKIFLPLWIGIFSIANIYVLISFFLKGNPRSEVLQTDMSFFISGLFLTKLISDTFGFIASIDFHKQNFKIIKIANTSIQKLIWIHLKTLLKFETVLILIIIVPTYFYFNISGIVFLLCIFQMILLVFVFNLYFMLTSSAFPNFRIEDITKLPSTRARVAANILI